MQHRWCLRRLCKNTIQLFHYFGFVWKCDSFAPTNGHGKMIVVSTEIFRPTDGRTFEERKAEKIMGWGGERGYEKRPVQQWCLRQKQVEKMMQKSSRPWLTGKKTMPSGRTEKMAEHNYGRWFASRRSEFTITVLFNITITLIFRRREIFWRGFQQFLDYEVYFW